MNTQAKEIFFSIPNVNSLYDVIKRTFLQKYNIDIKNNYLDDLKHGMQYIHQTIKISKNMDIRQYITKLNKHTYDNIVSYIKNNIKKNNNINNNSTNTSNVRNIQPPDILQELQSTSVKNENNQNIIENFTNLQKERQFETPPTISEDLLKKNNTLNIDSTTTIKQNLDNTEIYKNNDTKKELVTPELVKSNNQIYNKPTVTPLIDNDNSFNPSIEHYIPHINHNERSYLLTIDSFDRNRVEWPNTNNYKIHLGSHPDENGAHTERVYQNIKSIQLVHCVLANTEDLQNELYLLLHIEELGGIYDGSNLHSTKAFAKLNLYRSGYLNVSSVSYTGFVDIYQTHLKKIFQPKLATLDKMTISFKKHDGTLFNFGTDTPANQTYNMGVQNSLTFRIITEEADVTDIENENENNI